MARLAKDNWHQIDGNQIKRAGKSACLGGAIAIALTFGLGCFLLKQFHGQGNGIGNAP
jgi:hypothetical protein